MQTTWLVHLPAQHSQSLICLKSMTQINACRPLEKGKSVKMQKTDEAGISQKAGKPKKFENLAFFLNPSCWFFFIQLCCLADLPWHLLVALSFLLLFFPYVCIFSTTLLISPFFFVQTSNMLSSLQFSTCFVTRFGSSLTLSVNE